MVISELKLRNLKPKAKSYQEYDGGGLFVDILVSGKKIWRLRYRLSNKQEKVTLGEYQFTLYPKLGNGVQIVLR